MRLRRVLVLVLAALALAGCVRKPAPRVAAVANPPAVVTTAPVITPVAVAAPTYRLDSGDRLRILVFGQEGLSNSYVVDAAGFITLPLIGSIRARGNSPAGIAQVITAKLRQGFVREPHVAVEIELYRPFFILGEVAYPGQYPYVPNMTVETAVAIAGGFTPRAFKQTAKLSRDLDGMPARAKVPMNFPVEPGDTINVPERWF